MTTTVTTSAALAAVLERFAAMRIVPVIVINPAQIKQLQRYVPELRPDDVEQLIRQNGADC